MPANPLPTALEDFIARSVHSVEQLEILCLVSAEPGKVWTAEEVFRVIQSSLQSVSQCLEMFTQQNLLKVENPGAYRFAAAPELERLVAELARAYRERRVTVVETIYRKQTESIQDFAEAFRLRKEK